MKVLVDGDACPVLGIILEECQSRNIELVVISDTSHLYEIEYGTRVIVDKQRDSSDYVILNHTSKGDLVVTQDYGLASMCLAKGAKVIHPLGYEYTNDNIDGLLFHRYEAAKAKRSSKKKHLSGPSKRVKEDDDRFYTTLLELLKSKL